MKLEPDFWRWSVMSDGCAAVILLLAAAALIGGFIFCATH